MGRFLLFVLIAELAGGCASMALPPRLSATQQALVRETRLNLTVGVDEFGVVGGSDLVVESLTKTHLFARVDRRKNFSAPPDLVVHIESVGDGTATIPIWTGLTFGIIPTTVDEGWGYSLFFSRPGDNQPPVHIDSRYRVPTTLGWAAMVINLSPTQTGGAVEENPQFIDALAWAIVSKKSELQSLLSQ